MFGGTGRHFGRENIPQPSLFLFKTQKFPILGLKQRGGGFPLQPTGTRSIWLEGKHRSSGSVTKKAGANEHTRIVIEVKGGAADLDANRKHPATPARIQ